MAGVAESAQTAGERKAARMFVENRFLTGAVFQIFGGLKDVHVVAPAGKLEAVIAPRRRLFR